MDTHTTLEPVVKPANGITQSVSAEHVLAAGLAFPLESVVDVVVDGADLMVLFQDDAALLVLGGADMAGTMTMPLSKDNILDLDLLLALSHPLVTTAGDSAMAPDPFLTEIEPAAGQDDNSQAAAQNVDNTGFRFDDFDPGALFHDANINPQGALSGTSLDYNTVFEQDFLQDALRDLSARLFSGFGNGGNDDSGGNGLPQLDAPPIVGVGGVQGIGNAQQHAQNNAGGTIGGLIGIDQGNPGLPLPLPGPGPLHDGLPDSLAQNQHPV